MDEAIDASRKSPLQLVWNWVDSPMRFRHRGLRRFYERGDEGAIAQNQQPRIRLLLTALEHANRPGDLGQPGFRLHPLRGSDEWSVRVSGNWRLTFRFVDGEAVDVDLVDYH